jgi:hypothetical protein
MGVVAIAASACALVATVRSLKFEEHYFIGGCILSCSLYLGFLLLLAFPYFTRMQLLILLATNCALAALLVQAAASKTEWVALSAILLLPAMPFVVAGGLLRIQTRAALQDDTAPASETLNTLVWNKRRRGLVPQADSAPASSPTEQRRMAARRAVALGAVVLFSVGAIGFVRRRMALMKQADYHWNEEQHCVERVFELEDQIKALEAQDSLSEAQLREISQWKRDCDAWNAKGRWHAAKAKAFDARWW